MPAISKTTMFWHAVRVGIYAKFMKLVIENGKVQNSANGQFLQLSESALLSTMEFRRSSINSYASCGT